MRFMVIRKFKMSFKKVWHMVCRCSGGWIGVVLFCLEAMANYQTITFFPVKIMQLGICNVVFDSLCGDNKV